MYETNIMNTLVHILNTSVVHISSQLITFFYVDWRDEYDTFTFYAVNSHFSSE